MTVEGLRARKKNETHRAIRAAALELFFARGFDEVSIADVAEAANVSKVTVFKHFAAKEDLVYDRLGDAGSLFATAARARPADQSVLAAVRAAFLSGLRAHDPETGLNEHARTFLRLVENSPTLRAAGWRRYVEPLEELAGVLRVQGADDLTARVTATALIGLTTELKHRNHRRILAGRPLAECLPEALAEAERAFDLLAAGLISRPETTISSTFTT